MTFIYFYLANFFHHEGEMHVLFEGLEKGEDAGTFKPLLKALWDTWGEVEAAMKE